MTERISKRISDLLSSMPKIMAPDEDRAAWLDQKAIVFDAIADDEDARGSGLDATSARESADLARDKAAQLRGGEWL